MANTWPGTLPETFEAGSYRETPLRNVIETRPEGGSMLGRKRFSATPLAISGSMIMTAAQWATFKTFFAQEQGRRFAWTNLIRGSLRYYYFASEPRAVSINWSDYRVDLELLEYVSEFAGN